MENFETAFQKFFDHVVAYQKQYHESTGGHPANLREFSYTEGRRYVKVLFRYNSHQSGSVYCFIDKKNGDVLKAASWNAPAKGARGNIFNRDNGTTCCERHGIKYLR